jgi:hypothetical protein
MIAISCGSVAGSLSLIPAVEELPVVRGDLVIVGAARPVINAIPAIAYDVAFPIRLPIGLHVGLLRCRNALRVPVLPRWDRRGIFPQASSGIPRVTLSRFVALAIVTAQLVFVLSVDPRAPGFNLIEIDISAIDGDFADHSSVLVELVSLQDDFLAEHQVIEMLAGSVSERLPVLRRVDSLKPDRKATAVGIYHGDSISVGNANYLAGRGCAARTRAGGTQSKKEESYCGKAARHSEDLVVDDWPILSSVKVCVKSIGCLSQRNSIVS